MLSHAIAMIGLDEQDSILVRTALELASGIEIAEWGLIDDATLADVLLVNVNSSEGRILIADLAYLESYWEAEEQPIVVRCMRAGSDSPANDSVLTLPLVYTKLIGMLKTLQPQLDQWRPSDRLPQLYERLPLATDAPTDKVTPRQSDDSKLTTTGSSWGSDDTEPANEDSTHWGAAQQREDSRLDLRDLEYADNEPSDVSFSPEESGKESSSLTVWSEVLDEADDPAQSEPRPVPPKSGVERHYPQDLASDESFRAMTRQARQFHSKMRFLGILADVITKGRSVVISHPEFPPVLVLPKPALFRGKLDVLTHSALFRVPAPEFEVTPWFRAVGKKEIRKYPKQPLWVLLYCAALYGSEGRLRQGVNPYSEMRLREVPDFRVVPYEREHGKIVDFMLDQVADLETIARNTGVPIETVIEFTNACDELLLIDRYFNDLATEDGYRIGRDNKFWQRLYSQIPGQSKRMSPGFWGAVLPRWAFRKR